MFDGSLVPDKTKRLTPYALQNTEFRIKLDANESFVSLPETVLTHIAQGVAALDFNRYPDPEAKELCHAFAAFYGIPSGRVAAGNGSDELISLLCNSFAETGDKILTFSPDFSMYSFYAHQNELQETALLKGKENFSIPWNKVDAILNAEKFKLCIFSNPCNPTGRLERREDIAAFIQGHPNTIFVVDEAYMDFVPPEDAKESMLPETERYSNLIVLKTLSKAFGAAALRIGFAVGDAVSRELFFRVKSPYNVNAMSQLAGRILLAHGREIENAVSEIRRSKEMLEQGLLQYAFPGVRVWDSCTNFVLASFSDAGAVDRMLKEYGISVRLFQFGAPWEQGFLRITAGSADQNEALLLALRRFFLRK